MILQLANDTIRTNKNYSFNLKVSIPVTYARLLKLFYSHQHRIGFVSTTIEMAKTLNQNSNRNFQSVWENGDEQSETSVDQQLCLSLKFVLQLKKSTRKTRSFRFGAKCVGRKEPN